MAASRSPETGAPLRLESAGSRLPDDLVNAVRSAATTEAVLSFLGCKLKPDGGGRRKCRCPLPSHGPQTGDSPPFKLYPDGGWKCFACDGGGGDGIALWAAISGSDANSPEGFRAVIHELAGRLGVSEIDGTPARNGSGTSKARKAKKPEPAPYRPPPPIPGDTPEPVCRAPGGWDKVWPIRNSAGELVAFHCRIREANGSKKDPWFRAKSGLDGIPAVWLPLYGSEALSRSQGARVWIVEGEKAADALRKAFKGTEARDVVLGTVSGSTPPDLEVLRGLVAYGLADVVLWPDRDSPGRKLMQAVGAALVDLGLSVRILTPSQLSKILGKGGGKPAENDGADAHEWQEDLSDSWEPSAVLEALEAFAEGAEVVEASGLEDQGGEAQSEAQAATVATLSPLPALSVGELLALDVPPAKSLAGELWTAESLAMVFAPRGVGKTWISLALAVAMAAGRNLCDWDVSEPSPVLVVDGEMQTRLLQSRLARLLCGSGAVSVPSSALEALQDAQDWERSSGPAPAAAVRYVGGETHKLGIPLHLLSTTHGHRTYGAGVPDLDDSAGREWIESHIEATGARVLILDNLSALCRSSDENEARGWGPFGEWLIRLRARGLLVVLVHHSGKSGDQRGTSRREDPLDVVVKLERPHAYDEEEGCRIVARITKARHLAGVGAASRILELKSQPGGGLWFDWRMETEDLKARALEMLRDGSSQGDVAKELGKGKGTINRWKQQAERDGIL